MQKIRISIYRLFFKKLGRGVVIKDGVTFKFPSDIEINDGVKIAEQCYLVGLGGLSIGTNALIGAGTKIATTNHVFSDLSKDITHQGISYEPILIEDNVWLGFNVVVLSGCIIKKGAIVAANAVVTNKLTPENSIIMGVPAKIKKIRS